MCGITGVYSRKVKVEAAWIKDITDVLKHRGPDDEGYLAINTTTDTLYKLSGADSKIKGPRIESFAYPVNLMLGHRRLSILDPSASGHQPMSNRDGSTWIIHNGEIYNYIEIRAELKGLGYTFSTNTDTEVLLYAYEAWGDECLSKFNGMWAFVIYDKKKNILFGARDRFGVRPLYFYNAADYFVFASEIKALVRLPFIKKEINQELVFDYLVTGWEESMQEVFFKNIFELEPAFAFSYDLSNAEFKKWPYYELTYIDEWAEFSEKSLQEYANLGKDMLFDAVKLRLRSDVPVGACLSGGLDSSALVSVIDRLLKNNTIAQVGERQKVFTASYNDSIDESGWARLVVEQTKTDWYRTHPKASEFLEDLEDLIYTQDMPFGSTSIYAQYRVMKLASESGIKVLLDGQGGDELFSGYKSNYVAYYMELLKGFHLGKIINELSCIKNSPVNLGYLGLNCAKFLGVLFLPGQLKPGAARLLAKENTYFNSDFWNAHKHRLDIVKGRAIASLNRMLYKYVTGLKLKTLLRYADRNSMRFSVELRSPFADDVNLIEYAFRIPSVYKIHNGFSKYALREMTSGLLPEKIRQRTDKVGFATPEYAWLNHARDELKDYITDDLSQFINVKELRKHWDGLMLSQSRGGITTLWRFINLAVWMKVYGL